MSSQADKEKGFTLIELLVVIGIIGLLASIAIPAYITYKQRAIDDHMIRDLKNAAVAMEAYYADTKTYAASVSNLVATGLRQTTGVTLTITLNSETSYDMTASKPSGTKPSWTYKSDTGLIQ